MIRLRPRGRRCALSLLLGAALSAAAQQSAASAPAPLLTPAERLAQAQRREAESDLSERAAALAPLPAPVFTPPPAAQKPAMPAASTAPPVPASAPAPAAPPTPAPAAVASSSEEQSYNSALTLIQARSLPAARDALNDFTRRFPGSRRLPNAAFWQAEIDFLEERWGVARDGFLAVTKNFPDHPKAADSLYKSALCSLKLNDKQTAIGQLNDVLRRFPGSEAAQLAEKKLAELTKRT
jgi:tol-pal system protein YbgF